MKSMDRLIKYSEEFHIHLSSEQLDQFSVYYELLIDWNQKINLTAVTEWNEVVIKHFIDSLSIVKLLGDDYSGSVIDVGTGAGFPGIPIKILYPNASVLLADSLAKRIQFLDEVINQLHLLKIESVHSRAEDLAKSLKYREQYDICVSRAVANLSTLSEYCLPFVKIGGMFVAYKSEKILEEKETAKKAIYVLGGNEKQVIEFTLPNSDMYRCLYIIEKISKTSAKYPRKAGLPNKEPIV